MKKKKAYRKLCYIYFWEVWKLAYPINVRERLPETIVTVKNILKNRGKEIGYKFSTKDVEKLAVFIQEKLDRNNFRIKDLRKRDKKYWDNVADELEEQAKDVPATIIHKDDMMDTNVGTPKAPATLNISEWQEIDSAMNEVRPVIKDIVSRQYCGGGGTAGSTTLPCETCGYHHCGECPTFPIQAPYSEDHKEEKEPTYFSKKIVGSIIDEGTLQADDTVTVSSKDGITITRKVEDPPEKVDATHGEASTNKPIFKPIWGSTEENKGIL